MRITTDMVYSRTIFNLSGNLDRYMSIDGMVSSGRRINTPPDDPIGTHHDLNYRTRLGEIEQYPSNNSQGSGWMETYEIGLGDLKDLYSSAFTTVADILNAINSCGLDITASVNEAGTGIRIVPNLNDRTLNVENSDSSRTANSLGVNGSSDMLGSLMHLVTALQDNDRELAEKWVGNMDLAMNEVLGSRATVGSRMMRMDTTRNRLENTRINVTKMLSDVEDADMVTAVSDPARQENLYKAALMASSSIMQYSLVDFLR